MLIKKFLQTFTVIGLLLSMPTVITDAEAQKKPKQPLACNVVCTEEMEACEVSCLKTKGAECRNSCRYSNNICLARCLEY
jgi:hypothetical protein